jgi:hypothetical protein
MNGHCDFIGRELSPINSGVTVTRKHRVLPPKVRAMPKRNKARPQLKIAPLYCPVNKDGGRLKHLENWGAAIMSRLTSWMWCRKKTGPLKSSSGNRIFTTPYPWVEISLRSGEISFLK